MRKYLQDISVVNFYGNPIFVGLDEENKRYAVPLRMIVEDHLGLKWQTQLEKVKSDPLFEPFLAPAKCFNDDEYFNPGSDYLCIPVSQLPMFLAKISVTRIPNEEVRDRVLTFQRECMLALHDYWMYGAAVNSRDVPSDITAGMSKESPRRYTTERLYRMCKVYASHFDGVEQEDIFQYANNKIHEAIDPDNEDWGKDSMGFEEFLLAWMERATAEILRLCITAEVTPNELPEKIERNIQNCWAENGGKILAVATPYAAFAGLGTGAEAKLV